MRTIQSLWRASMLVATVYGVSLASIPHVIASKEKDPKKIPVVFLQAAEKKELFDTYSYPARVIPMVSAEVLSEAEGVVTKVFAPLGKPVKKGEKILSIQHTDPVYQYAKAIVRAPVSGVVSKFSVRTGTQVKRGQELLTVTDPEKVKVSVEVAAVDLPVIRKGIKAKFRPTGREEYIDVEVSGVSPFVDPRTGTATCELVVESKEKTNILYPGVVGQVTFKANERKGFVVPDIAIYYQGKNPLLRVVDDKSISREVAVKLGKRERGTVEVLSGLKPGDRFIQRASRHVADGQEVIIQGAEEDSKDKKTEGAKGA